MKRDGLKASTALHGPLGITYHLNENANMIENYLENQFVSHDPCDKNQEKQVETRVQALLASVDDTPLGKLRPCYIHNLVNSWKLREACGLDGIPNKYLVYLPRRPLVNLTHLFNHCIQLSHFPKPKEEKVITLPKPSKVKKR
jgi:hypothetical protein